MDFSKKCWAFLNLGSHVRREIRLAVIHQHVLRNVSVLSKLKRYVNMPNKREENIPRSQNRKKYDMVVF